MQHRIDVIHNSVWKPRFASIYNQFKDQITKEIITGLDRGRIVRSKSRNSIGMFTQPKRDTPLHGMFLLDCNQRNLEKHGNETTTTSIEQITEFIGYRPFRSEFDLTDGDHNVRIHPDPVSHSTFISHMVKFDSLVMQHGARNAPATMMRAIHYPFREVKDTRIYLDDILIVNSIYQQYINTVRQVLQIANQNELWFNRHKCQFMPDKHAIRVDFLTELGLEEDPHQVNTIPQFPKPDNCKEVTYRVCSFVTTSPGYPDMLSCDLHKQVS